MDRSNLSLDSSIARSESIRTTRRIASRNPIRRVKPVLEGLPSWPRYLGRAEAAAYLGVSVDVFDDEVRAGIWPPPRRRGAKGGRHTWDKALLDSTADSASGIRREHIDNGVAAVRDLDETRWMERIDGAAKTGRVERGHKSPK
jgi:hypothetical protein